MIDIAGRQIDIVGSQADIAMLTVAKWYDPV